MNVDLSDSLEGAAGAPEVSTPPTCSPCTDTTAEAAAIYEKYLEDMKKLQGGPLQYPNSPTRVDTGSTALVNLGVAPGQQSSTGFAVQYGKPREADAVKLLAFPKPGSSFEKWWDHAIDSISAATSFCTEAYRWASQCEKAETTFEDLAESGGFVRLDALLLQALMECIPGDTHLLRQEIKKAKAEQRTKMERNITGRQVLFMIYKFFAMNSKDKDMTDTARLHKVALTNGDIQQFVFKWDEVISRMTRRPPDDDLMNLFVLQFDVHLPKAHEFYVEYLFWYNRLETDPVRCYEGLWKLVHDFVRRKNDTKNRKEALKDHLPNMPFQKTKDGKGKGKDGKPQICFSWRNNGSCAKKDAGTCQYDHPKDAKGTGRPKGDSKGGKGNGKQQRSSSTSSKGRGKKGDSGNRSPSPKKKIVTDTNLLCRNFLKGKCDKGDSCKYHHNGACRFFAKGNCSRGDACIYGHSTTPAAPANVQAETTAAKAAAKKKDAKA